MAFQTGIGRVRTGGLQAWQLWIRDQGAMFATATSSTLNTLQEESQIDKVVDSKFEPMSVDVSALCREGKLHEALGILKIMDQRGIRAYTDTYGSLLQGCAKFKNLENGKQVHEHMIKHGFEPNLFLDNLLLVMYSKCGSLQDARDVFEKMPKRNVVSWTAITSAALERGRIDEALKRFSQMQKEGLKPDIVSFITILNACTSPKYINQGKLIHAQIAQSGVETSITVANALISMYARCGGVSEARKFFDGMPERDVISWTALLTLYCKQGNIRDAQNLFDQMPVRDAIAWSAMIAGYAHVGQSEDAFQLLYQMQQDGMTPDKITYLSILGACKCPKALEQGKQIHAQIIKARIETDVRLGNALVIMYANCGSLSSAQQVFDSLSRKDVVSWTSLLNAYIKFGQVANARTIFDKMPKRDTISWNSMINGYAKSGQGGKAVELFHQMEKENVKPDDMTFVGVLKACAGMGSLQQGLDIHSRVLIAGFESDLYVQNALVDMYIKCGSLETARNFFNKMQKRDVVSWNVMIFGFSKRGCGKEAVELYKRMLSAGVKPDSITFAGVLSACKKEGLVEELRSYFASMRRDHGIKPTWQHYNLLSREMKTDDASPSMPEQVEGQKEDGTKVEESHRSNLGPPEFQTLGTVSVDVTQISRSQQKEAHQAGAGKVDDSHSLGAKHVQVDTVSAGT